MRPSLSNASRVLSGWFSETIASYSGIAREIRGDALVAEFPRASDGISASLAFQAANAIHNQGLPDKVCPVIRVGVALGEVVVADDTVTGEGVVLAQRLEQLAGPGGVVVQGSVSEAVPKRMPFEFESLGEQVLKGFSHPVMAFVARLSPGEQLPAPESYTTPAATKPQRLEVPNKPSIAVLPFTNMSGDPQQEYFSDGITEDLITNLSRFRDFFVIASTSSFAYKGKAVNVQDISRELGVRYILEGSIQRSGERVRINAQLIDGSTGRHLWAERYQRQVEDIFSLQDEVVELIVGTLATGYGGRLRKAWQRRGSENLEAFDCFMRGMDLFNHWTKEDTQRRRELFEEAVQLDPNYGKAYAKLAWSYMEDAIQGWSEDYEDSMAKGLEFATKGIEREEEESWVHWALAGYHVYTPRHELALAEFQRAMELNPNDADVLNDVGWCLSYAGRADEGLEAAHKAMRLNPHYPEYYLLQLGQIYFDARKYEDAIATFERPRSVEITLSRLYLAANHAASGNADKAKEVVKRVLELDPEATVQKWASAKMAPYKVANDLEHFRNNLRKAGLPD